MRNRKGRKKRITLSQFMMVPLSVPSLLKKVCWQKTIGERQQERLEMAACIRNGNHEIQEDAYRIEESKNGLFAVIVGGQGKRKDEKPVSRFIAGEFIKLFYHGMLFLPPKHYFIKAFQRAQKAVLKQSNGKRNRICAAAVLIREHKLYYGAAGGNIVAILQDGRLIPIAKGLKRRSGAEIFSSPAALFKGESVVLISRGLYKAMEWEEIEGHVKGEGACEEKVFKLMERLSLNDRTKKTNASVVMIKVR